MSSLRDSLFARFDLTGKRIAIAEPLRAAFDVRIVLVVLTRHDGTREIELAGVGPQARRAISASLRRKEFDPTNGHWPLIGSGRTLDGLAQHVVVAHHGVQPIACINLLAEQPLSRRRQRALAPIVARLEHSLAMRDALSSSKGNADDLVEAVLEANPNPVVILTADGRIVRGNRAATVCLASDPELADTLRTLRDATPRFEVHPVEGTKIRIVVIHPTPPDRVAALLVGCSARTIEVVRLLATGISNKEIAAKLGIADNTVEYHLTRSYAQLGVRTRVQLLAMLAESAGPMGGPLGISRIPRSRPRRDDGE